MLLCTIINIDRCFVLVAVKVGRDEVHFVEATRCGVATTDLSLGACREVSREQEPRRHSLHGQKTYQT